MLVPLLIIFVCKYKTIHKNVFIQIDKIAFLSGFRFKVYMYVKKLSKKIFGVNYTYLFCIIIVYTLQNGL